MKLPRRKLPTGPLQPTPPLSKSPLSTSQSSLDPSTPSLLALTSWGRRCVITIPAVKALTSQSNFPILLTEANLPAECLTTGDPNAAKSDGSDIRFSLDAFGATELPREIVNFFQSSSVPAQKAEIYVKINITASVDNLIYIWYKNPAATEPLPTDPNGSYAVWSNSFPLILHYGNGSTLVLVNSASPTLGPINNSATAGPGKFGGGVVMASGQYLIIIDSAELEPNQFTISFWMKRNGGQGFYARPVGKGSVGAAPFGSYYFQFIAGDGTAFGAIVGFTDTTTSGGTYSTGTILDLTWYKVDLTFDASGVKIYINGISSVSDSTVKPILYDAVSFSIGCALNSSNVPNNFFVGTQDELRFSNVARSSDWLSLEYSNQNGPSTFAIPGTPSTPPVLGSGSLAGSPISMRIGIGLS